MCQSTVTLLKCGAGVAGEPVRAGEAAGHRRGARQRGAGADPRDRRDQELAGQAAQHAGAAGHAERAQPRRPPRARDGLGRQVPRPLPRQRRPPHDHFQPRPQLPPRHRARRQHRLQSRELDPLHRGQHQAVSIGAHPVRRVYQRRRQLVEGDLGRYLESVQRGE